MNEKPSSTLPPLAHFVATLASRMGEDDLDAVGRLLGRFAEAAQSGLADAELALSGRNAEALTRTFHKLKSSSAMIGADTLSETCRQLEAAGRMGDWAQIEALMPAMRQSLAALVRHLLPDTPQP